MKFDELVNKYIKEALYSKEGQFLQSCFIHVPEQFLSNPQELLQKIKSGQNSEDLGIFWSRKIHEKPNIKAMPLEEWKKIDPELIAVPDFSIEGQPFNR
jgi:hypothetical protein